MPDEKWTVGSEISLYKYSFGNEFEGNVKAEVMSATMRKTTGSNNLYFKFNDVKNLSFLTPENIGVPKSGRYYTVVLDKDDLGLAKKLVLNSMRERIIKLRKGIDYTRARMQDVRAATL